MNGKEETKITIYDSVSSTAFLLSHPLRLRIIEFLNTHKTATWKEIIEDLENIFGRLNPNTINFHLTMLVNKKIIEKKEEKYRLINSELVNSLIKAIELIKNCF